ncbi:MAG TPA: SulP family inorganic anion transporter [Bryobacteraceae bacterium]|nr:SulP family inorganic anion transporter [Bryobacteraceae bacterium]
MSAVLTPEEVKGKSKETKGKSSTLTGDLISSLVVFLVALPLCMGIAIASGVPPALGIATGVIGGIIVGMLSGAPLQVSGPAAGLAVIVFEAVREFGIPTMGVILLLAGVVQLLAGRFKMGQWFRAISPAVVYGMLAGIGVLIVAGQFHVMVDDKPHASGLDNILAIPQALFKAFFPPEGTMHHMAASIGVLTLVSIVLWNQFRPASMKMIPGSLIGVVLGTAAAAIFQLNIKYVDIPTDLWSVFTLPNKASMLGILDPRALIAVLTVALIASAETLLSTAAVDRMHTGKRADYDKELSAQGVGNILCGLIGAIPMTGVIVRSSANVQAGAKTRLSAILHGVWLLVLVLMFPSVLRLIPMASLAGILVYTGYKLVDLEHLAKLKKYGKMPVFIYAATLVGIVGVDLLTGVLIGLALTVGKVFWKATRFQVDVATDSVRNRTDVNLKGLATFLRLPKFAKALDEIPASSTIHVHIQDLYYIDHTCLDLLKATAEQREAQGGQLEVHWEELAHRYHLQHMAAP